MYANRWKTLAVLCASLVIVIVGNTVLNVALPTLQEPESAGGLGATNTAIQWIVDAYGLGDRSGLVDRVVDRQQHTVDRVLALADRGLEPWAGWVRSGLLEDLRSRPRWTRAHRHLVE